MIAVAIAVVGVVTSILVMIASLMLNAIVRDTYKGWGYALARTIARLADWAAGHSEWLPEVESIRAEDPDESCMTFALNSCGHAVRLGLKRLPQAALNRVLSALVVFVALLLLFLFTVFANVALLLSALCTRQGREEFSKDFPWTFKMPSNPYSTSPEEVRRSAGYRV